MSKKDDKRLAAAEPEAMLIAAEPEAVTEPEAVADPVVATEPDPVVPPAEPAAVDPQIALDQDASLRTLFTNAEPALAKIVAGWASVLEGVAECEEARKVQAEAANVARASAEATGAPVYSLEFGHNALAAKCWDLIAALPAPVVDFPAAYVRQFGSEQERFVATQVAFNHGSTIVAPGYSAAEIHDALIAGVRGSDIQSGRVSLAQLIAETL